MCTWKVGQRWHWLAMLVILTSVSVSVTQAQLGTMARVTPLAKQQADGLAGHALVWIADRITTTEEVTHQHELGFVYAEGAAHTLRMGDQTTTIDPGQATAITMVSHTHSPGTFIEMRLSAPGSAPLPNGTRVFATEVVQGIPAGTVNLQLADVVLPPNGGQTNIHTHPGTETIYARAGSFEYQSALHGTELLQVGAVRSLPPNTPVQKRNTSSQEAAFLALFIVDPEQPLASEARFDGQLPDTGIDRSWWWGGTGGVLLVLLGGLALRLARRQHNIG